VFVGCRGYQRRSRLGVGRLVGLVEGSYHGTRFVGGFCHEEHRRRHYRPMAGLAGYYGEEERLLELGGVDLRVRPVLEERIEIVVVKLHERILKTSL